MSSEDREEVLATLAGMLMNMNSNSGTSDEAAIDSSILENGHAAVNMCSSGEVFEYTEDILAPKDVRKVRFHPSVTEVQYRAFSNRLNLTNVVLNKGLKKIGIHAFRGCRLLPIITLPSTLTKIGEGAFECCTTLREIILNEGLTQIGWCAFKDCASLESITLPSTVTEIGSEAFRECSSLRKIVFRNLEGLRMMGQNACFGCTSLQYIKITSLSTRCNTIIQAGQTEVENNINNIQGVRWEDGEILISARGMREANWNRIRGIRDQLIAVISYYEVKEATTIFELALWKFNMDQAEEHVVNRKDYRMDVPGPVKEIVLQYFNM